MKTAVIFYSFGGFTRKFAEHEAKRRNAQLFEVKEQKKTNMVTAVLFGCPRAMRQKTVSLESPVPDLSAYDTILIAAPIWANYPAPAFNNIVKALPKGKNIVLVFTSGSGDSSKCRDSVKKLIDATGSWVVDIKDIKSGKK